MNTEAMVNGQIVEIVERKGGWTTIIDHTGTQRKVRNGQIQEMPSASKMTKEEVEKVEYNMEEALVEERGEEPKKATEKRESKRDLPEGWHTIGKTPFDLSKYMVNSEVRTASGRPSVDAGDRVATNLRGKGLDEVYEIAAQVLEESAASLQSRYEHLNPGMQRMNLGNRIRAAMK